MNTTRYITHADLAEHPGTAELSQCTAQDGEVPVPPQLLTVVIAGGDTADWTADELVQANMALGRIDEVITDTQGLIDGFLRQRGHRLPLAAVPPLLTRWARAIVRYQLNRNRVGDEKTDPVIRDYKEAMAYLEKVAAGKYSLGIEDPLSPAGGAPQHTGPGRTFDMHSLRDFGK